MKKILIFLFQETPTLTISFFKKRDLEWHSCCGEMSVFDELNLGLCLPHPVFLSDVLSDVIGVISKYRLTTCVFSKAEIWRRFL